MCLDFSDGRKLMHEIIIPRMNEPTHAPVHVARCCHESGFFQMVFFSMVFFQMVFCQWFFFYSEKKKGKRKRKKQISQKQHE